MISDDFADLPSVLADVAREAGRGVALRLAADFGGTEIYVPRRCGADHALAKSLGLDAARVVCRLYGGGAVEIPLGPAATASRQARRIRELIASVKSAGKIARMVGCTTRTVRRYRNERRDRAADTQGRLF